MLSQQLNCTRNIDKTAQSLTWRLQEAWWVNSASRGWSNKWTCCPLPVDGRFFGETGVKCKGGLFFLGGGCILPWSQEGFCAIHLLPHEGFCHLSVACSGILGGILCHSSVAFSGIFMSATHATLIGGFCQSFVGSWWGICVSHLWHTDEGFVCHWSVLSVWDFTFPIYSHKGGFMSPFYGVMLSTWLCKQ